jgi:hypothetical protein
MPPNNGMQATAGMSALDEFEKQPVLPAAADAARSAATSGPSRPLWYRDGCGGLGHSMTI